MKKKVILIATCAVSCILIYGAVINHSNSSNTSSDYEYHYNENSLAEGNKPMSNNNIAAIKSPGASFNPTPDKIDTEPSSITVFVNQEYSLPENYIPDDLVVPDVLFDINYYSEKKLLREEAADALEKLFRDAKKHNLSFCGVSGYRSFRRQTEIYNSNLRTKGLDYTNRYSAKPGYSEHQSGLSIDVSTPSIHNRLDEVFCGTPEGKWLKENAHRFGFIIRYPKEKENITGYSYEPWHIRYVGKTLSKYLYENNLTLEEYYNYKPGEKSPLADTPKTDIDPTGENNKSPLPTNISSPTPTPISTPKPNNGNVQNNSGIPSNTKPVTPKPTKKPVKPTKKPNNGGAAKPTPKPTKTPPVQSDKPQHSPTPKPTVPAEPDDEPTEPEEE